MLWDAPCPLPLSGRTPLPAYVLGCVTSFHLVHLFSFIFSLIPADISLLSAGTWDPLSLANMRGGRPPFFTHAHRALFPLTNRRHMPVLFFFFFFFSSFADRFLSHAHALLLAPSLRVAPSPFAMHCPHCVAFAVSLSSCVVLLSSCVASPLPRCLVTSPSLRCPVASPLVTHCLHCVALHHVILAVLPCCVSFAALPCRVALATSLSPLSCCPGCAPPQLPSDLWHKWRG
jgi:hypothetical protein